MYTTLVHLDFVTRSAEYDVDHHVKEETDGHNSCHALMSFFSLLCFHSPGIHGNRRKQFYGFCNLNDDLSFASR